MEEVYSLFWSDQWSCGQKARYIGHKQKQGLYAWKWPQAQKPSQNPRWLERPWEQWKAKTLQMHVRPAVCAKKKKWRKARCASGSWRKEVFLFC